MIDLQKLPRLPLFNLQEWAALVTDGGGYDEDGAAMDALDYAEHMDVTGFYTLADGSRAVTFADGVYTYSAFGAVMIDADGPESLAVIDYLESCGVEFEKVTE